MTEPAPVIAAAAAASATDPQARRLARLAAVQGLYQMALTEHSPDHVIKEFRRNPHAFLQEAGLPDNAAEVTQAAADQALFGSIVTGVAAGSEQLDEMINGAVDAKFSAARLEILLRAILRAGAYELYRHSDTATGIIINDYVDIAHAFFNAKEPGMVNAILDKIAKNLRQG